MNEFRHLVANIRAALRNALHLADHPDATDDQRQQALRLAEDAAAELDRLGVSA